MIPFLLSDGVAASITWFFRDAHMLNLGCLHALVPGLSLDVWELMLLLLKKVPGKQQLPLIWTQNRRGRCGPLQAELFVYRASSS